jgi:hypothetical protein
MRDIVKTVELDNGYKINIYPDDSPFDPREDGSITHMICFHNRYNLGDKHDFYNPDAVEDYIAEVNAIWLPLYLYDHSGISMSTNKNYPFNCPWDSGQVGVIYITLDDIRAEMARPKPLKKGQKNPDLAPIKHITKADRERVIQMLESEVSVYNSYLTGDVYGWEVIDPDGEFIDSCWGYYGYKEIDYMIQEAQKSVDYDAEKRYSAEIDDRSHALEMT